MSLSFYKVLENQRYSILIASKSLVVGGMGEGMNLSEGEEFRRRRGYGRRPAFYLVVVSWVHSPVGAH